MYRTGAGLLAALVAGVVAAGCGGDDGDDPPQVREGAVVLQDALDSDANHWLVVPGKLSFHGGAYEWNDVPPCCVNALPDAEVKAKLPDGVATSVDVQMRRGAALRGVTCREAGTAEERENWYELGIDGRRALVRRMKKGAPPKVLATADAPVPNGRKVRLTGRCVPDGDGLALSVLVDGREAVSARDGDPVSGPPSTIALFAYKRPDSKGSADLTWDAFAIRSAAVAGGT